MNDLDALIALACSPEANWTTIRQEGRSFHDRLAARQAFEERRKTITRRSPGPKRVVNTIQIGIQEREWRLWRSATGGLRSEYVIGRELVTIVARGNSWTRSSPTLGTVTGSGTARPLRTLMGPAGVLLDPTTLLNSLEPISSKPTSMAGRAATMVTARPIPLRGRARMALREAGLGADEYDIAIDVERGVLLSVAARRGKEPFQTVETTSIAFDEVLEPELFVLAQGSQTRERLGGNRRTSLEDAAKALDFTLFIPDPSPSPADPHVAVHDGERLGPGPKRAVLTFAIVSENRRGQLRLTESGVDLPRSSETWERRGELEITLGRQRAIDRAKVRCRIEGTTCELESSVLELDRLVEIAATLRPLVGS